MSNIHIPIIIHQLINCIRIKVYILKVHVVHVPLMFCGRRPSNMDPDSQASM